MVEPVSGRLFLSLSVQISPAGDPLSVLTDFWPVFLLFSDPVPCILLGREVVRLSGWPASSVSAVLPAPF